jgi:hypothetical protein
VPTAESVLVAADRLDVAALRARCAAWIHDNLLPNKHCASVWGTAEDLCVSCLIERVQHLASDNILKLYQDQSFLHALRPHHLHHLLQLDSLCINSEDDVVHLILNWVQAGSDGGGGLRDGMLAELVRYA